MEGWRSWALLALTVASGCGTRPVCPAGPVPPPSWALARVNCGRIQGSGCLVFSDPRFGSYVLTAAHLVEEPPRVLAALASQSGAVVWGPARVLRIDRQADLALLWRPDAVAARPRRLTWAARCPPSGAAVELLVAVPEAEEQIVRARVTDPGVVITEAPLAAGMSGAGLFCRGDLAGILYGHRASGSGAVRDGRYVRVEAVRRFLEPPLAFLATGGLPAEPE
ncbi:MAG: trypsin-like peptidase domain-containing protein [Planctomycetes bacterium]|nr:trypsin-like peptidase domain-containing protein [Planctomycetota bacterium]